MESWLSIVGWPGYDVSDGGRLRSWKRPNGRGLLDEPRIIGTGKTTYGHPSARLCRTIAGRLEYRSVAVHILVLEAFVGPRPAGLDACHNNGDPADNRLSNLRWDTTSSNMIDTLIHGTTGVAKLRPDDIPTIWSRIRNGDSLMGIARDYRVSSVTIARIRNKDAWNHITDSLPDGKRWHKPILPPAIFIPEEIAKSGEETWRLLPGWEAYRLSNFGRVQTRWGPVGAPQGWIMGDEWKPKSTSRPGGGRPGFTACDGRGSRKDIMLHVAMLETFACPRPLGMFACHNDGDITNNHASNLRWDSPSNNSRDRFRHDRSAINEKS